MRDLIIRHDGTFIEDFSGELIPVKVHYTRLDAPPSIHADHAVAIERNRCLAIIDQHLAKLDRAHMPAGAFRVAILREQIAGHDPSTPPAAQKRG